MKKFFAGLAIVMAGVFTSVAMAAEVGVFVNPHYDGKRDPGTGIGLTASVQPVSHLNLSLNYAAGTKTGDRDIADMRIGTSVPIIGKLSGLAEIGYGSAYEDGHWKKDLMPAAVGVNYSLGGNLSLAAKANRYFGDNIHQDLQYTLGLNYSF